MTTVPATRPRTVIENWDQFTHYLAAQPLCRWSAQKQRDIAAGKVSNHGDSPIHASPPKNDNADLAAALASMA